jgi:hypothetical protein
MTMYAVSVELHGTVNVERIGSVKVVAVGFVAAVFSFLVPFDYFFGRVLELRLPSRRRLKRKRKREYKHREFQGRISHFVLRLFQRSPSGGRVMRIGIAFLAQSTPGSPATRWRPHHDVASGCC